MDYKLTKFQKFSDRRGDLIVFLDESDVDNKFKKLGQIYFVTFKDKGVIRGNHYHKKWHEWFGIVAGKVAVILEDVQTKERVQFKLDANANKYLRLEIGPYVAHCFYSITKYAAVINYADSKWYGADSIKYKIL